MILYTGVVLRPGAPFVPRVHSLNLSEQCTETQLAAVAADPGAQPRPPGARRAAAEPPPADLSRGSLLAGPPRLWARRASQS